MATGCSAGADRACVPTSRPLADGETTPVTVVVSAKAEARYIGDVDVSQGFYTAPQRTSPAGSGALTDLPAGTYDGTLRSQGQQLVLSVRGQNLPLTASQGCD